MFNLGKFGVAVELDTTNFDAGMKSIETKTKRASGKGGLGGFAKSIGKIAGGLGVFTLVTKGVDMVKQSLDGAIDRYDTLNNFPRVMEQIGFDADESQASIDKLSDGIQGLPTRLDEVAGTAQSIAIMTGDLDGATDTTLALNNAFLASGASSDEAERGIDQYTKMLSKNEVDLQSWRTLQETMPFALRETAEAFGFTGQSATNDFYDALKDGDITMDDFNSKLIDLDQAQGGFAETAKTASSGIKTAWTNMQTWVVMGVTKIIDAIDEAFGGVGSIEGMINSLKPVFDSVFSGIASAIIKTADVVRELRDRFNNFRDAIAPIVGAMKPLGEVISQTAENVLSGFMPIWENLKTLFDSLMPIIEILATLIGGALMTAIVVVTSVLNGLLNAVSPIVNAFISLVDVVVNVFNSIIAVLTGDFQAALDFWDDAVESSVEFFKSLWESVVAFIMGIVEAIIGWFEFLYEILVGNSIIPDMVEAIVEWFNNMWEWLVEIVTNLVESVINFFIGLYENVIDTFQSLWDGIMNIWEGIKSVFGNAISWIDSKTNGGFSKIFNLIKSSMNLVSNTIKSAWDFVKNTFSNVLSFLKGLVTGDFGAMRQAIQNQMQNARNLVSNVLNNIKSFFSNTLGSIVSNVRTRFNKIRDNMLKPIEKARDKIKSVVDKIKGFFSNMKLSIPKIKLPKLPKPKISGGFSLKPPRVPKISWNALGGVFRKPTIFNTANAGLQGVGEAGSEAILPLTTGVLGDIGRGISSTMNTTTNQEEISLLKEQNNLLRRIASKDNNTYLDSRKITQSVNDRQGTQYNMKNYMRGNR